MNRFRIVLGTLLCLASSSLWAQKFGAYGKDAPGAQDHPIVHRYAGSWLLASEIKEPDALILPVGAKPSEAKAVQGRISRMYYLAPRGQRTPDVQRYYEQSFKKAGATKLFSCAPPACPTHALVNPAWQVSKVAEQGASKDKFEINNYDWGVPVLLQMFGRSSTTQRLWVGSLPHDGTETYILVGSSDIGIQAGKGMAAQTAIIIVETTQIVASASATNVERLNAATLHEHLESDGKVPLYGILFESGKADLKPESQPQLDEIASLLQTHPTLKLVVTSHTDNQGTLDPKLLSELRAQAVMNALVRQYKIDAQRLLAVGLAHFAPVSTNTSEAGRTKNKRIELVVQ